MIAWSKPRPLPKDLLDPSAASLLPKPPQTTQPFFVDTSTLIDAVPRFVKQVQKKPQKAAANMFSAIAASVTKRVEATEGFVLPVSNAKSAAQAQNLIGPSVPKGTIKGVKAAQSAFKALQEQNLIFSKGQETKEEAAPNWDKRRPHASGPVAMGVIDFSIAFLNKRFRKANGETRFEMMWIQDRVPLPEYRYLFPSYQLLGMGTVLLGADINALIAHFTKNQELDEEAAYAAFTKPPVGMRDSWAMRDGHGTAVLDHMAGADPGTQDDERPLYGVELPTAVLIDTSGQSLLAPLLLGLTAISVMSLFLTPAMHARPRVWGTPLVINASLAFTGGPDRNASKNGFALMLDRLMGALQTLPREGLTLTVPTGNHRQDRIHAAFGAGGPQSIVWGLPPDDLTTNAIEIYVEDGSDLQMFSLKHIGGPDLQLGPSDLPRPGYYVDLVQNGDIIARLAHPAGFGPTHYTITTAPTARRDPSTPIIQSGSWEVSLRSCGSDVNLWVRRDNRLSGFPNSGRQSWFVDPAYEVYDPTGYLQQDDTPAPGATDLRVFRQGTGSVLQDAMDAGANGVVSVAGLQCNGAEPYRFSGERRAQNAQATAQDVAEVSRWTGGPVAAARRSGAFTQPAGTSIASALYARQLADSL
ncbi:MAG: hypothetical protein ABJJ53_02930 [Sulfitobacter sp.]